MSKFTERCELVREASYELAALSEAEKNELLKAFADKLRAQQESILAANALDYAAARENGMSEGMLDRLLLNPARIEGLAKGVTDVMALPDPIGRVLARYTADSGIEIEKISVPLGVVGIIYEARPNVTSDCIALCIKSGNAVVLKGGKEAVRSNLAIAQAAIDTLKSRGLNENYVYMVEDTSRETTAEMMRARGLIDVLIPRGGKGLISAVVDNAAVPVIETGAGNCHIYVEKSADFAMALNIIDNAKTSRPSVCNAAESILIDEDIINEFLPLLAERMKACGVELRGDERCQEILGDKIKPAEEADYYTEYNALILSVCAVSGTDEAIAHIRKYGTHHSDAIVTTDEAAANRFLARVDSAAVYVNASTRFTDGGEFGLGAEIGISTQKLHARGPMGLVELTSYKYAVRGSGQVR